MRVLYFHQYFASPQASGGTRSYEFARRLLARGHHVCMVTSSAMLPPPYHGLGLISRKEIAGIPCVIIDVPYSNAMPYYRRIAAFIRFATLSVWIALTEKADVVFATSTPLTIAVPAVFAKVFRGIPMVFEVRDLWPDVPIAIGALRNPILRRLARWLERLAYSNSQRIVALSPGMAAGVVRNGGCPAKVEVIPNCCDIDLFDVPETRGREVRRSLNIPGDVPLILYAGTFGKVNGVGYLVEIAAAMRTIDPRIQFLLVGSGAEKEKIMAQARDRGVLGQNLLISDPIPKAKMPDYFSAATLTTSTVIPLQALWDNSANKFFDSFAAGKPIAINHGGWQADLLNKTGTGIVLPERDYSSRLPGGWLFSSQVRISWSARGKRRVLWLERSLVENMANKLELVLSQAARRS